MNKYGTSESWKQVELERYVDALYRHFLAFLEDNKSIGEESKLPHYAHMDCNIAFIIELINDEQI